MKVQEITTKVKRRIDPVKMEEAVKKARKEYEKPCKGMFEFVDAQGGWLDFTDRPFPGDPIRQYHINHGEICELPLGLVKRLNNTKKKIRNAQMNADKDELKTYSFVSRIRFTPMEVI